MLVNHPVLLLARQVAGPRDGSVGPRLTKDEAAVMLVTEPVCQLLNVDRIEAVDKLLSGDFTACSESQNLSDHEAVVAAILNEQAANGLKCRELRLKTAHTTGRRSKVVGLNNDAIEAYRRAVELADRHRDRDSKVRACLALAEIHRSRGDTKEALDSLSCALLVSQIPNRQRAGLLIFKGEIQFDIGELEEAETLAREALKLYSAWTELMVGGKVKLKAQNLLGRTLARRGRIAEGIAALEDAPRESAEGEAMDLLLQLYLRRGDLPAARALFEKLSKLHASQSKVRTTFALSAFEQMGELKHWVQMQGELLEHAKRSNDLGETVRVYRQLCRIKGFLNDRKGVQTCFQAAAEMAQGVDDRLARGRLLFDYAMALDDCGDSALAEGAIGQAIGIFRNASLGTWEADALLVRATFAMERQEISAAEEAFREVRRLGARMGMPDLQIEAILRPVEWRIGLGCIAGASHDDLAQALLLAGAAENLPGRARALVAKGNLLLGESKVVGDGIKLAAPCFEEAQEIARKSQRHDLVRTALERLGWCAEQEHSDAGRARARERYREAIDSYFESRLGLPPLFAAASSELRRNTAGTGFRNGFDHALRLATLDRDVPAILLLSEQQRAQTLCEWIKGDPFVPSRSQFLRRAVEFRSGKQESVIIYTAFRDHAAATGPVDKLVQVVMLPDKDPILLELDADGAKRAVDTLKCELRRADKALRGVNASRGSLLGTGKTFAAALEKLSSQLLPEQVLRALKEANINRLTFVPHFALNDVPFTALTYPGSRRHLIEDFEVAVAPSVEILAECRMREADASEPVMLGVAQPTETDRVASDDAKFVRHEILRHFQKPSRALTGADATAENFLSLAPQADVIHLMIHGRLGDSDNPQGAPSLEFSGGSRGGMFSSDSLLELVQRGKRFSRCRLITMNVCFSTDMGSVGGVSSGDIGGFPAAMLALGVPALVGSKWLLYSGPGQLFFKHLYHCLRVERIEVGSAFRQALLRVKNYRGPDDKWEAPFYDHAYIWGGIMLIGDGGKRL